MPEPGRVLTREHVEAMVAPIRDVPDVLLDATEETLLALARSHEQLREAAEYVRDASLITADDAMLTDALEKLDAVLAAGEEAP